MVTLSDAQFQSLSAQIHQIAEDVREVRKENGLLHGRITDGFTAMEEKREALGIRITKVEDAVPHYVPVADFNVIQTAVAELAEERRGRTQTPVDARRDKFMMASVIGLYMFNIFQWAWSIIKGFVHLTTVHP